MSRKYKFGEKSGAYFISFATVFWIDVFTRDDYFCCITEALDGNVSDVLVSNQFLQYYQKIPPIGGTTTVRTTDYLNGFQYFEGKLEFFATSEGYVKNTEDENGHHFNYVYNYTDHLGNVRLSYGYDPIDEVVKILEENNYYAYGLKHNNYNMSQSQYEKIENTVGIRDAANGKSDGDFDYKYNGKEWQDEFGLNMYDMDFRDYDPAIGRWVVIDPIDHFGQSPYNGYDSNPVLFADPSGATTSFDNWVQGVEDDWAAIDAGANPFSVFNARIDSNHRRDVTERIKNRRFMSALIDALTGMLGPRGLSVKAGPLSEETEQTKYREKGAKNGEIFNFDNSLLDRFKDSGLNPEAKVGVDLDRNKEIMKVIDKVGGLKEFYAAMGSPKITDYGSSSMGYRGFTFPNNTIAIYNGAYSNYFLLASTIFHELVHIYQNLLAPLNSFESEQQSYRVEWKLGDPSLKRKYKDIYRSIWIHTYFNDKYPY